MRIKAILSWAAALALLCACAPAGPAPAETSLPAPTAAASSPAPRPAPELEGPWRAYLDLITVEEGCSVTAFSQQAGERFQYAVYELRSPEVLMGDMVEYYGNGTVYWQVVVLDGDRVVEVLRVDRSEYVALIADIGHLVWEADVDFDGKKDVLLWLGGFGNQGAAAYRCYLQREDGLELCPSFEEIPNPAVDEGAQAVLGSWRNSAASHGWAVYRWEEGELGARERLTRAPADPEDPDSPMQWTEEVWENGVWRVRQVFTGSDQVGGPDSNWGVDQDRWKSPAFDWIT